MTIGGMGDWHVVKCNKNALQCQYVANTLQCQYVFGGELPNKNLGIDEGLEAVFGGITQPLRYSLLVCTCMRDVRSLPLSCYLIGRSRRLGICVAVVALGVI
jgi:hypothetical protein